MLNIFPGVVSADKIIIYTFILEFAREKSDGNFILAALSVGRLSAGKRIIKKACHDKSD